MNAKTVAGKCVDSTLQASVIAAELCGNGQ